MVFINSKPTDKKEHMDLVSQLKLNAWRKNLNALKSSQNALTVLWLDAWRKIPYHLGSV